ncbi:alpha/beta fold hydrolase [Beijerinckia indica]|uniref:Alpha/beta hydrolase fold n=1 Tax=Beijerinckia indica subsp. indica (strain ATCC 9039 / DSM 1715 / NCIMB 8712) TaxID=395963 RepID=B2IKS2_BEII9|nr:alpha/beta hydrolase [Beijerinckia indica]ACB95111.1 alpha/beta hydrolase fold [Beijerinckia indica subsp. indica ATCC 9039]
MTTDSPIERRAFLTSALTGAAASVLFAVESKAQPAPATPNTPLRSFETLKHVRTRTLDIAYAEAGPAEGTPVLLLHGWPYDIHSYVDATPILAEAGYRVIVPYLRGYGSTRFLSDASPRNAQQAVLAVDMLELIEALGLKQPIVGGYDWGARTACILAVLYPERVKALVSVSGYLIGSQAANAKPLPPAAELSWWYQFYFATERGRLGYAANTHAFARLIWQTASPRWAFDEATFTRSAAALDNPDHVAITIHNYRWRLGLAEGEARYDAIERQLATFPSIRVPTIILEGDANGAPHPRPEDYRNQFVGPYQHRLIEGGVGHNLPQEAPQAFARAISDADRMTGK